MMVASVRLDLQPTIGQSAVPSSRSFDRLCQSIHLSKRLYVRRFTVFAFPSLFPIRCTPIRQSLSSFASPSMQLMSGRPSGR